MRVAHSASLPRPIPKPRATRATSFDPQIAKAFGLVVRAMREELGIAQDAFALAAGVDRSYYGKLERGERQPSLSIFLRVSTALGSPGSLVLEAVEKQLRSGKARARRTGVD
jgi:XRE family transcriptional regulator, regulator of sulfur utilization